MEQNVVIKCNIKGETGRNILAGILKQVRSGSNWNIRVAFDDAEFRQLFGDADAIIADSSACIDSIKAAVNAGKPVVLLNDWRIKRTFPNVVQICTDDDEIGRAAANYLLSIGRFRSFGYVPAIGDKEWSMRRERAFLRQLKNKGFSYSVFKPQGDDAADLRAWLKSLPKPTALFCAWDGRAVNVVEAAKAIGARVPSQIALLGVDNIEAYCTTSTPHISSIEFDGESEGMQAAKLLAKLMTSHRKSTQEICIGRVKRIVERESTRPPAPAAHLIERAMKFISENATKGIGPKDVVAHLGVSRTLLDLRFREMETATVGKLILEKRLDALSTMLRKSKSPIYRIIKECGFGDISHAKAVFKKRFGLSMRAWRKSQ